MAFSFAEALKPKPGSKHLSTIIDAEGRAVQAETREDELQKIKYQEIIGALVGAGYFRAQIKALSEFDKVVGGMTWCIDLCNMDLDIDLLFQENSTIGQKISLTEKIVAVLPKMKCPLAIEPHQIQGLDFIHIFPVVEWLVKRSLESREERGDYLRLYAVHCFDKDYAFPDEKPDCQFVSSALTNVKAVQSKYGPQRKYRLIEDSKPQDTMSRIQRTLFEYGYAPTQEDLDDGDSSETKTEIVDEVRMVQLIGSMTTDVNDMRVGAGTVSSIVSLQAGEIKQAVEDYSNLQAKTVVSEKLEMKRLQEKELELLGEKEKAENSLKEAMQKLEKLRDMAKPPKIERELSEREMRDLNQLEKLLFINESLKEQELQFKEQCKVELIYLQTLVKEAEEAGRTEQVATNDGMDQLSEELAQLRIELAATTRAVSSLHRLLDQVPSRAELAQYQRRFLELYNQVAAKHKETKQYYTLYNTLSDTQQYLTKELSLLNSILEGYNGTVNASITAKEDFMKQFETIVDGVKQNKAKIQLKMIDQKEHKEKLRSQFLMLLDQQRQYASVLKQFTVECHLNQTLVAQLRSHSGAAPS